MTEAASPTHVILAIEDDPVQARLYEHVLDRPGWRMILAPTLAAARRAIDEHRISAVLLDLFLPDGDGRQWLSELRARREYRRTPVIVVAGSSVVEAQVDCYELGADTMLSKPVAPQVLLAAVNGALQRESGRATPPVVPAAPPPAAAPARAVRRVLLAEDDDVVAALVQHRLGREGFSVERFTDGAAALEAARDGGFDLAILDVMMPGIDGFELLASLRRLAATRGLPIIMLTGLGGERDVERALSLGANDYVLKPFSPVELTARVQRLLKGA
jgi:DNA-binding response OmpR family regulator